MSAQLPARTPPTGSLSQNRRRQFRPRLLRRRLHRARESRRQSTPSSRSCCTLSHPPRRKNAAPLRSAAVARGAGSGGAPRRDEGAPRSRASRPSRPSVAPPAPEATAAARCRRERRSGWRSRRCGSGSGARSARRAWRAGRGARATAWRTSAGCTAPRASSPRPRSEPPLPAPGLATRKVPPRTCYTHAAPATVPGGGSLPGLAGGLLGLARLGRAWLGGWRGSTEPHAPPRCPRDCSGCCARETVRRASCLARRR